MRGDAWGCVGVGVDAEHTFNVDMVSKTLRRKLHKRRNHNRGLWGQQIFHVS
jgi:hypothetical protein